MSSYKILSVSIFVKNFILTRITRLKVIHNTYILFGNPFFKFDKALFITSFSLFGLFKNNETLDDKLIITIKRSILCIKREQYDRAEQMLHLALRMAQDLQSNEGIIYVYDIMANLAMDREEFQKAEKLFADVMRRLLNNGLPYENLKILHISSKLSRIAQLKGDIERAKIGFSWSLLKIKEYKKKYPDDIYVNELLALTTNWFGELLMKENDFKQAKQCFKDAYDSFVQIHGHRNEEAVIILNNLSVACFHMEDFGEAKSYILTALDYLKGLNGESSKGILLANLGLIYIQEGLTNEAKKSCSEAWKFAKAYNSDAAIKQAEYCLNEIKKFTKI